LKFRPQINNRLFWIFLALLLKGIYFWSHVYSNYPENKPLLGHFTHDSKDYYSSMNNFYLSGDYSPDERMPGVGILYLVFRPFFEHNTVLNILLILQWITSSIAVYMLSLLMARVTKREAVFYFVFLLAAGTHYLFVWDTFYFSESFCITVFIFSLWYLHKYYENSSNKDLFFSGSLLAWCCFMRPVFFIFYMIIGLFLLLKFIREKHTIKNISIKLLFFAGMFIVFDGLWTLRNWRVNQRFIPLNDIAWYSEISDSSFTPALYLFLESWGGDLEREMSWFESENISYEGRDTTLPSYMYTSQFNYDSLYALKQKIRQYRSNASPELQRTINLTFQRYTRSVEEERPMLNYFGAGFIYLKKLLFNDYGNLNKMNKYPPLKRIYAYGVSGLFYLIFFTGLLFSVTMFFRKGTAPLLKLMVLIAFVNMIYIAFFFRTPEFRYLLPSTLVYLCFCGIALEKWKEKITSARQ
jgi:hypothetical protein